MAAVGSGKCALGTDVCTYLNMSVLFLPFNCDCATVSNRVDAVVVRNQQAQARSENPPRFSRFWGLIIIIQINLESSMANYPALFAT